MRLGGNLSGGLAVAWCFSGVLAVGMNDRAGWAANQHSWVRRLVKEESSLSNTTRAPIRVSLHPSLERDANNSSYSRSSGLSDDLDIPSNDEEEATNDAPVAVNATTNVEVETVAPVEVNTTINTSANSDNSAEQLQSNESGNSKRELGIVLYTLLPFLVLLLILLVTLTWRRTPQEAQPSEEEDIFDDQGCDRKISPPLSNIPERTAGPSILRKAHAYVS